MLELSSMLPRVPSRVTFTYTAQPQKHEIGYRVLCGVMAALEFGKGLVFTACRQRSRQSNTRRWLHSLHHELSKMFFEASLMHGIGDA